MNFLKEIVSRRGFFVGCNAFAFSYFTKQIAFADNRVGASLYRPDSREGLFVPLNWNDDDHLKCSVLLRDIRDNDQAVWIDPDLIELVIRLNMAANQIRKSAVTIHISSGYRTKKHNSSIEGAAKSSLHMGGRAMDYTIPGFDNLACAKLSAMVGAGGVGVYKTFSHMDTGKNRTWIAKAIR